MMLFKKLRLSWKSCVSGLLAILIFMIVGIYLLATWPVSDASIPNASGVRLVDTPSSVAPDDLAYALRVRNFLEGNGYCEPPCWLGIRAGGTKLAEVKNLYQIELNELVIHTVLPTNPDSPHYRVYINDKAHGIGTEQILYVEPQYGADEGVITTYSVSSYAWQRSADSYYAQVMKRYLLPGILNQLGAPDLVAIIAHVNSNDLYTGNPYYEMLLYYFNYGTLITYVGDLEEEDEQLRLCPHMGTVFVINQWWPYERYSKEKVADLINEKAIYISLEQATGMNLDTFYKTFKDPDSQACLETPTEIWK